MTITLFKDKDCKHSVRYAEQHDGEPILGTVYVRRGWLGTPVPAAVVITIERQEA